MPDNNDNNKGQKQPTRKARLWLWFVAGFLVVFIGMSFIGTMHAMHPSGNAVIGCKLWQYYIIEMQQVLSTNTTFGPATHDSSALVTTAFQHLLCSAVGGAVMLGIGWVVGKIRGRRA